MTTATLSSARPHANDRFFYGAMAVAAAALVFAGFSRSFYLAPYFNRPVPTGLRLVHGLVFSSWILLFLVQTALIATRRVAIHRRLGVAGAVIALLMVILGTVTAIGAARAGHGPPGIPPLTFLAIPLFDMAVFAPLVAAAIYLRRSPQAHKRLMLLATVSLLAAAAARLPTDLMKAGPLFYFGVADLFILVAVLYDLATRHKVHPAYVWGGLLILVSQPLRLAVSGTEAWQAFARMLIG
ncbi:MAG TPA: hypothetical protein VFW66_00850 [Gemmatimonadales bacterium]|nr:hypothetical protein [Gemmatimonadales bacterium]